MKTINRILLLSIFITLLSPMVRGQENYFKILTSPSKDGACACVETDNGDIILQNSVGTFLEKEYVKFIKIDSHGDTIASKKFRKNNDYYDFTRTLKLGNDQFIAVGSSFDFTAGNYYSIHNKVIYYTFNSNLDSLSFHEITMDDGELLYFSIRDAIINSNNNIVALCEDMTMHNIMLMEATMEGDSVRSSRLIPQYGINIYSIMQKFDHDGYYITCEGDYNHLNHGYISHVLTLDSVLQYAAIDSLPGECAYFSQIKAFNDDILIGGRARRTWISYAPPYPPPYRTEEYCIERMNTNFETSKQVFLSHVYQNPSYTLDDTISYPALFQNFDFIDTNNIFSCHYREYPELIYPQTTNYFVITRHNADLSTKWQYYVGHDAFYAPNHILATSDGGCFVSGNRYDCHTQFEEFDVFYLKLDSTGLFASTNRPEIQVHSVLLYPNPVKESLTIESGPQLSGALFSLFDSRGRMVLKQRITSTRLCISISHLDAGVYVWKASLDKKVVDCGKIIKE